MKEMRYKKRRELFKTQIEYFADAENPNIHSKYVVFKDGYLYITDGEMHLRQNLSVHGLGLSAELLNGKALRIEDVFTFRKAKGGYTVRGWCIIKHLSKKEGLAHVVEVPLIDIPANYPEHVFTSFKGVFKSTDEIIKVGPNIIDQAIKVLLIDEKTGGLRSNVNFDSGVAQLYSPCEGPERQSIILT